MIRKPNRSDAKRLTTGVLVAGVVAAGAVALASPASAAAATTLSITPKTADAGGGTCVTYTVNELDGNGAAATTGFPPYISATPSADATTYSDDSCSNAGNQATLVSGTTYTFSVGAATSTSGTVTVKVSNASTGGTINASATLNVAPKADDFVKSFTVAPSGGATADANGTVPYLVTPLDTNGNPVVGADVRYQFSAANTDNPCTGSSETLPTGTIECDVPAGTTSSTVTFYVNNSASTSSAFDSGVEPSATSAITVQTAKAVDNVTVTCANQGADDNSSNTDCFVPTGTKSETFTATVENTPTGSTTESPVSGAVVTFSVSDGDGTLSTLTATTNASGIATVTLTPSTSTADETDTVRASSGGHSSSAEVEFQTAAADQILITPGDQTVQIGSTVTETAQVVDQFGNPVKGEDLEVYTTTSRNNTAHIEGTTSANGSITLTYTDKGTTAGSDTIEAYDDTSDIYSDDYTVQYVASVTPTAAALNFGGSTTTCPSSVTDPKTTVGSSAKVCVLVSNANGTQVLANSPVTFTVSQGTVADTAGDAQASGATATYKTTTNDNGIAIAYVSATKAAAQTISVTAGGFAGNTLTDTYAAGTETTLTVTPTGKTFAPGGSYQFTATATDKYGNPTPDYIFFLQTGPGALSSNTGVDAPNGVANVVLVVPANADPGSGTITAQSDNVDVQGTATYTVANTVAKSLSVNITGAAKIGSSGKAKATVTGTDGNPLAGEVVSFSITGATTTTGMATTNSSGVATFNFTAKHAGSFTVTATASSAAVSGAAKGSTAKTTVSTTLSLTSPKKHQVHEHATLSLAKAGIVVHFYAVSDGKTKYIGKDTTNGNGVAILTVTKLKSGTTYKASARSVGLGKDYKSTSSGTESQKVK